MPPKRVAQRSSSSRIPPASRKTYIKKDFLQWLVVVNNDRHAFGNIVAVSSGRRSVKPVRQIVQCQRRSKKITQF
jgi:hypothetical protein